MTSCCILSLNIVLRKKLFLQISPRVPGLMKVACDLACVVHLNVLGWKEVP